MIRLLRKEEGIPYDLLLLADETVEVIDKYIFLSEIFVYEIHGEIVALYVLQVLDSDAAEIKNIAVRPELQRQGIGRFLLRDAANRAKLRGLRTIVIGTGDASTEQLKLYEREGFEAFALKRDFFLINYPAPIYENGVQLRHMIMLRRSLY